MLTKAAEFAAFFFMGRQSKENDILEEKVEYYEDALEDIQEKKHRDNIIDANPDIRERLRNRSKKPSA